MLTFLQVKRVCIALKIVITHQPHNLDPYHLYMLYLMCIIVVRLPLTMCVHGISSLFPWFVVISAFVSQSSCFLICCLQVLSQKVPQTYIYCLILQDCAICFEKLCSISSYNDESEINGAAHSPSIKQLNQCKHAFHASCLQAMYNSGTKASRTRYFILQISAIIEHVPFVLRQPFLMPSLLFSDRMEAYSALLVKPSMVLNKAINQEMVL